MGRGMALGLAEAGARLAVVAKSPEADELGRQITAVGAEFFYISADLSKPAAREGLIQRVVDRYGRLDILINNAAIYHREAALTYPIEQWNLDLEILLTAVLDLAQQAGRVMLAQGGGKIINIASVSSFQGSRQIIGYATAKHGLVGLTKCLANEWAGRNVHVNAIAPGLFETEMVSHIMNDPARTAEMLGRIPSGRFGKPEDLVGPVLFLASEASRHVHGHVLLVDGGWMGR